MYPENVILLVYLHLKNVIYAKTKDRKHSSGMEKQGSTASLNKLTNSEKEKYSDIQYGIKFCMGNVGFNGHFYTFPYFMAFMLKRYLRYKATE